MSAYPCQCRAYLRYGSSTNRDGTGTGPHQVRQYQIGMALPVDRTYDVTGNLTNDGTTAYTWNTQLQPIQVSRSGFSEAYTYDADGTRVTRTTGGQTTVYLEGGMWEESTATTGTIRQTYTVNGQAIAVRTIADKSNPTAVARITSIHGDHLGSVSVTSESGVQTGRQDFDPWGNIRGTASVNATRRGFTGQYRDDSGLLFYNARSYHPFLSRFISADTIVPGSTPLTVAPLDALAQNAWSSAGSGAANPQDLNRYSYVGNNPVNDTDPTGHCGVRTGCFDGSGGMRGRIPPGAANAGRPVHNNAGARTSGDKPVHNTNASPPNPGQGGRGDGNGKPPSRPRNSPHPDAEGAHSVFRRDPHTGQVTHYTTYEPNTNPHFPHRFQEKLRYDGKGEPHFNQVTREYVPTPHINDRSVPGKVRPAIPEEIPGIPTSR